MEYRIEQNNKTIQSFTDLIVWQEGHKLVLAVYALTRAFPKEELFGLVSQMRRAVVSITSNIAEGFARRGTKEKIQFYLIARGSLVELESQMHIVEDLKYSNIDQCNEVYTKINAVHKLLNSFIKSTDNL